VSLQIYGTNVPKHQTMVLLLLLLLHLPDHF